jgi:hypothetical protein
MLQERVYGIACGYADANDAARLAKDGAMRLVCEKPDEDLASQPTLSRLENAVTRTDLFRFGTLFTDIVLERERGKRKRRKVRRITIDMDPTEDPTYGDQQLTFFNAYYDNWCYLPMVTTIQFDQQREQYLVAPVLRPGNAKGSLGAISILKRLVPRLRKAFPRAEIFVRMDGAFATPEVFSWLEEEELPYVVNMAKNPALKRFAEPLLKRVRRRSKQSGQTEKEYGEARYQATKWKRKRRAVIKAEVVRLPGREPRDNPRFVITNLSWSPKGVYRFYRKRGDAENRIRELKDGLRFDLTSCTKFEANQFRNLLTAAAYALYQQLRYEARGTECERAQVWTLRPPGIGAPDLDRGTANVCVVEHLACGGRARGSRSVIRRRSMSETKKPKRRKSARAEQKKRPMVIEVVFPRAVEADEATSPAEAAGKTAKTGKKNKSERLIFRF